MRKYRVTLYNQAANCSIYAEGRTRPEAFERALVRAGELFMRAPLRNSDKPRDILTTLRVLFFDHLMTRYYHTSPNAYASDPRGCGVEFRRID